MDILDHVNNVAYMAYFETGRAAFLEKLGMRPGDRDKGPVFVLAHISADYLAELAYPGTVDIDMALRYVGKSAFHLGHGIFAEGVCRAVATSVIVQVEGHPLRSVPLTEQQTALMQEIGAA